MKNYSLTIFETSNKFELDSFFEDFSQVCDTDPFYSKLGKSYFIIFGSEVDLVDLSAFISSTVFEFCVGFTITEINSNLAAFFPIEKFEKLTLDFHNFKNKGAKMGKEKLLAILNPESLNKVYANNDFTTKNSNKVEIEYHLDSILEKIAKTGISSLTEGERNFLDNYSTDKTKK